MNTIKANTIYGSFYLDSTEIAVDVAYIQEVVNYPDDVVGLPLAPDFLIGVFKLRGMIIPVVNLKKLLKFQDYEVKPSHKVAILEIDGVNIGFVFDSTGAIIRPRGDESSDFSYEGNSEVRVIKGALKLHGSSRLLQILDPEALVSIKNIPQVASGRSQTENARSVKAQTNRKKCISFLVGDMRLAFEITGIHEILNVPKIHQSPLASDICAGIINLREHVVPIIRFSQILRSHKKQEQDSANQRVIVLKLGQELFGMLVDAIESINTYSEDAIMPIPLLSDERSMMFQGCITLPGGDVILLNQQEILTQKEVLEVTQGHSKIYEVKSSNQKAQDAASERQAFISFKLNHLFGIPIREVREIINYSSEILEAPGMPGFVEGVLNLRGKLVTIINTKELYNIKNQTKAPAPKIIIFQKESEQFGLVVDSVESIVHVSQQNKMKLPDIFATGLEASLKQDIKEVVEISEGSGGKSTMMVLSTEPLMERLRGSAQAM